MEYFGFQWHITDRCGGRCRHCYQSGFDGTGEQPVSALKETASYIMSQLNVPVSVNLTGGEPLLYKGLFDLMNFLSTFSNLDELNLITSSFGLDSLTIKELKKIDKLKSIKISLESHLPVVNDSIRGKGHFEMAAGNIRALALAEIPVVIMVTLGRYNYNCVEGLCALAAKLGAAGVIFERYVPLGQGEKLRGEVLNPRQWREILRAVCKVGNLDTEEDSLLAYKAFWIDMPSVKTSEECLVKGAFCNLGSSSMALMPDGTVFPCRRLPVPVGRLPDSSMNQLLETLSQYSPEVLRKEMKNVKCGSCQVEECCGCRALSLALGNGTYGDDPLCAL
ncbi:MAG: radical SAM protein [Chitinispirillales bacterium]|jgi:radical SAM protein with 4Fe4S-binding SPASM domain|nr:radical SAM protein [Chitinispirillales bacterium]